MIVAAGSENPWVPMKGTPTMQSIGIARAWVPLYFH